MKTLFFALAFVAAAATSSTAVYAADSPGAAAGARVFVEHEVADYGAWRKVYDAFRPTQKKLGVTHQAVYRSADNPNDVIVIHDFASVDAAKSFLASDELKNAMKNAGVKGAPSIKLTTQAR